MKLTGGEKTSSAFTLIELLIVIAILGVLAVVVLVLIKPAEKLAQTRDTGRISAVTQIGRSVHQYFIVHNETYPDPSKWTDDLVNTGDINSFPSSIEYQSNSVTPCTTNAEPSGRETYCYTLDSVTDNGSLVFSKLESSIHVSKCSLIGDTYVVHSSADGKTGIICSDGDPTPWQAGHGNYLE